MIRRRFNALAELWIHVCASFSTQEQQRIFLMKKDAHETNVYRLKPGVVDSDRPWYEEERWYVRMNAIAGMKDASPPAYFPWFR